MTDRPVALGFQIKLEFINVGFDKERKTKTKKKKKKKKRSERGNNKLAHGIRDAKLGHWWVLRVKT